MVNGANKPAFAVIIPAYNEERSLKRLLNRLESSSYRDFEIVVVSDASNDATDTIARDAGVRLIRNDVQRGPAAARNAGAHASAARFLLFFDADVIPEIDTLATIAEHLRRRPDVRCFSGVYSLEPANNHWFQRYRALLSHHYIRDLPFISVTRLFVSAVAGMDRELFEQLGGFDETRRAADAEDTELGYRIGRITPLFLFRAVSVRHEFPGFLLTWKNYYRRSAAWLLLRRQNARFDDHTTTRETASLRVLGALAALGSLALPLALPLNGIYLLANRRFLWSLIRAAPVRHWPLMYAADQCLGVAVLAGAMRGGAAIVADCLAGGGARRASEQT